MACTRCDNDNNRIVLVRSAPETDLDLDPESGSQVIQSAGESFPVPVVVCSKFVPGFC